MASQARGTGCVDIPKYWWKLGWGWGICD
jgi:hypothetical protein